MKTRHAGVDGIALKLDDNIFQFISVSTLKEEAFRTLKNLTVVLYVPRKRLKDLDEVQRVLQEFHDHPTAGHPRQQRLLERLKRYFVWKGMTRDVKEYVKNCSRNSLNKHSTHSKEQFKLNRSL